VDGMQHLTKRRLLAGAATASLGLIGAACGPANGAPGSANTSTQAAGGKVRIMGTFVDPTQGETLWRQWTQEIAANEKGVEAEFIVQPKSDIPDKLLTQVAAGDAPDVIQGTSLEYAARGFLADLTDPCIKS